MDNLSQWLGHAEAAYPFVELIDHEGNKAAEISGTHNELTDEQADELVSVINNAIDTPAATRHGDAVKVDVDLHAMLCVGKIRKLMNLHEDDSSDQKEMFTIVAEAMDDLLALRAAITEREERK